MKLSENWLREWVNPKQTTQQLAEQLTMAGLEVDAVEQIRPEFNDVVVGQITNIEPHPDADKLRICQVDIGQAKALQIVCGAPNARQGLKAPVAQIGAVLPDNFKIKKAKLRGVESQGMLCAGDELGLQGHGDGLWELPEDAPVGVELASWLQLDDQVIDVDLTPNRADCLGLLGLAREISALNSLSINLPDCSPVAAHIDDTFEIKLNAPEACPRYYGRVIRGIDIHKPTPLWMQEKLRRSGIRSIDPVVDTTNYVMLELGQPLHAFDLNQLSKHIDVRMAKKNDVLTLLDGKSIKPDTDTLLITDADKPLALAGIMGGEHSGVQNDTQDLFLECAYFSPAALAGKARRYGLHTDASHRYERGVDPEIGRHAIERLSRLILDIVGGQAGPVTCAEQTDKLPTRSEIKLGLERLQSLSGLKFDPREVTDVLKLLGCEILQQKQNAWKIRPPSWRFDLAIEVDLIEELTRIKGYDQIPEIPLRAALHAGAHEERRRPLQAATGTLIARGYREVITYSFIDAGLCESLGFDSGLIPLRNPIASDMAMMRPSLIPGLLKVIKYNQDRQESRLRLFEQGLRFVREKEDIHQLATLAGAVSGNLFEQNWQGRDDTADFFDLKNDVQSLLEPMRQPLQWQPTNELSCLHPARAAKIFAGDVKLGFLGELHPGVYKTLDLKGPVTVFQLNVDAMTQIQLPGFKPLTRYPSVHRDIAIVLDDEITADEIDKSIRKNTEDLVQFSRIFDIYKGQGIDSNKKSVALSLTFRHSSRTLNDEEVNELLNRILDQLKADFGAELRQ